MLLLAGLNMSLGQIIRHRREDLELTLDEVSSKTGFSKPYLSTIETGKVKNPPSDELLVKLERILKFQKGQLQRIAHIQKLPSDIRIGYETVEAENKKWRSLVKNISELKNTREIDNLLSKTKLKFEQKNKNEYTAGRLIPIINKVSAGYPEDFNDMDYPAGIADDYLRCPDITDANAFAVRVVGDSMQPKFYEGDIVIFSPSQEIHNGDDCFIRFREPHETSFKRVFFEKNKVRLQPRNEKYTPIIVEGNRVNGIYKAVVKYEKL
jgi:SOS-response transcriptional repressor LexA